MQILITNKDQIQSLTEIIFYQQENKVIKLAKDMFCLFANELLNTKNEVTDHDMLNAPNQPLLKMLYLTLFDLNNITLNEIVFTYNDFITEYINTQRLGQSRTNLP